MEQANALVFLCSAAASSISGITLITDSGYFAAGMTDVFPPAAPAVNFLLGRL
jgi:Na+/proline symporter